MITKLDPKNITKRDVIDKINELVENQNGLTESFTALDNEMDIITESLFEAMPATSKDN